MDNRTTFIVAAGVTLALLSVVNDLVEFRGQQPKVSDKTEMSNTRADSPSTASERRQQRLRPRPTLRERYRQDRGNEDPRHRANQRVRIENTRGRSFDSQAYAPEDPYLVELPQLPSLPNANLFDPQDDLDSTLDPDLQSDSQSRNRPRHGRYLGNLSSNPYDADSTSNPYGAGNPYGQDSVLNEFGEYGSKYSPRSVSNPYATDPPKLYDRDGNFRGNLSSNPYDPDSISNQYGRYGSPYSPDSVNNEFGLGSPYHRESPFNSYGEGLEIYGEE